MEPGHSVQQKQPSMDDLYCKCQQVAGVLATMALSEAGADDMRDALWGAHALAKEAQAMAGAFNWPAETEVTA